MELLKSNCIECRTTKSVAVSLESFCGECGLDRTGIIYEIPFEKFDEVMRDIFMVLDFHRLRPAAGPEPAPAYDEIMKRFEA